MSSSEVTSSQRQQMIAEAAYFEESLQAVATKGKRAGRKVRAQAQKIRDEIVELTQRLESTAQR
jgi:hypothetical protein